MDRNTAPYPRKTSQRHLGHFLQLYPAVGEEYGLPTAVRARMRHLYPSEGYHLSRVQGKKVEELPSGSVHMETGMACSSEEKANKEWGSSNVPQTLLCHGTHTGCQAYMACWGDS